MGMSIINNNMQNDQKHWDGVYSKAEVNKLGWYEEMPSPSLKLIQNCDLEKNTHIIDVGSGVTTLIKKLLEMGFNNVSALDISKDAIEVAKGRIGSDTDEKINWIVDDITNPQNLDLNKKVELWHDRTVLHFLTDENQQKGYLNSLRHLVKIGGYVIIAVFSKEGAKKCSGLDVKNYNHQMIADLLGDEFTSLEHFPYTYIQPSGSERPYIYTLFQRKIVT